MNQFMNHTTQHAVHVVRVADQHWHALEDDCVVGRGHTTYRPDGRIFVSVDAWQGSTFDLLADALLAALPRPLHTLVDEADRELTAQWHAAGFAAHRREWEYVVPTDPLLTGLDAVVPPPRVEIRALDGRHVEAAWRDEQLGLLRLVPLPRRPVIGLLTVRPDVRRRGIARALLARVLGDLHQTGTADVSTIVDETNVAGVTLAESVGGRRTGSQLELVLR
jgi:GNAT superfamily N-acetyltransferase